MTFKEKYMENTGRSEEEFERYIEGHCPEHAGLEKESDCDIIERHGTEIKCTACWNREMPNTEQNEDVKLAQMYASGLIDGKAKGYEQGLNDAWELANRLNNMTLDEIHKVYGFSIHREELFSAVDADEAIAKLKAYEEAQEINVGDVVKCKGYSHEYVVMATSEETFSRQPFLRCTEPPYKVSYGSDEDLIKTGKHINILEQIGE